ncbi:MAG: KH domain-containing protein [Armatimonadota bacterium]|nr:KH domain-containing protein [Armatimonadota bacterium]MDR7519037.1 KH domain-containing protein [Armatimonadota bacterium]MDR7549184.1 KH domain-containing protein [Armatimonadota bacterium]
MPPADLRALVEFVTRGLVDRPESVSVRTVDRDRMTVIEVRVAPEEVGKVIGRRGRIIGAIRTLVKAAAVRSGRRVVVEIVG